MNREEQNLLFGALIVITAIVLGVAAFTILGGEEQAQTAAEGADPFATTSTVAEGDGSTLPTLSPLTSESTQPGALGGAGQDQTDPAMADGSTAAPTLAPAPPAPPSTAAPAPTAAPSTTTTLAPSTEAPTTAAPTNPTTGGESSTTVAQDGSSTTASTAPAGSDPADSSSTTVASTDTTQSVDDNTMNALELEVLRLTNELRTNPNGPLAREKPVPDCGGNLQLDDAGNYTPIGALTLSEVASLQVARPWSAQMTRDLKHQDQAGAPALQAAGLDVGWVGENISYNNYPEPAMQHFVGWRESDGHFCNMMNPRYTHIGVGENTRANGDSFATQTFFTLR